MQMAATMLSGGSASIAAVGEEVGYASEAAFNRSFKKLVGAPPAAWRRQRKAAVQPS
jgi:AraC-like DNA-binding protein